MAIQVKYAVNTSLSISLIFGTLPVVLLVIVRVDAIDDIVDVVEDVSTTVEVPV